jgi:capsular polysaccharide transport system permease protein
VSTTDLKRNLIPVFMRRHSLLLITVVVPTLTAIFYYGLIASNVYISESRFVVRSPQRPAQTGFLGEILQSTGFVHSQDDTYSVRDFILSRDSVKVLDAGLSIKNHYSSSSIDMFDRFPGLFSDHSFEEFYRYYGKRVSVDYDPASSITVLTVRAYRAQDAFNINQKLVEMSEQLVNAMNDRSRHDLVQFAEHDVQVAADKVRESAQLLSQFRDAHQIYEPNAQAGLQLQGVAKLQSELVATTRALAELRTLSPDNPQLAGLTARQSNLKRAIQSEGSKVTSKDGSLSAFSPSYARLALDATFAEKQLATALAGLEGARSDATRKQLYLERLVQPNLPDKAMEPRRLRSIFTVFLVGLMLWGVAGLLLASVKEHAD